MRLLKRRLSFPFPLILATIAFLTYPALCFSLSSPCKVQPTTFEGWKGEEISNDWVRLIMVPRLGGRLMQITFGGHPYLFVNSKYKGQYFPPAEARSGQWFNYGGDKLWPLPEGHGAGEWPGPVSDALDDGEYEFSVVSQGSRCSVRLRGPADPATGLQYSREISIGRDSPEISFHAVMTNASDHPIRWSIQSVTQYDTADSNDTGKYNRDFWAFAPLNAYSAYLGGYHVRSGLADDPSFEVKDGLFRLHWMYLQNEVWLDSAAGWIAVVDDSTKYAMIEQFGYERGLEYPGKASVIFYKNGAALQLDDSGMPILRSANPEQAPYYMEAELNSPMISLSPGSSYAMDTQWFPVRAGKDLKAVNAAGAMEQPLSVSMTPHGLHLSGEFGVFFPGKLTARVTDAGGSELGVVSLQSVDPLKEARLDQTFTVAANAYAISVHLVDESGIDRGTLGEAKISKAEVP